MSGKPAPLASSIANLRPKTDRRKTPAEGIDLTAGMPRREAPGRKLRATVQINVKGPQEVIQRFADFQEHIGAATYADALEVLMDRAGVPKAEGDA